MRHSAVAALLVAALGLSTAPVAQAQSQPLTHDDYDRWEEIETQALSDDGAWVRYRTSPPKGDDTLQVKRVEPRQTYTVPRGEAARFTADAQVVVYMIAPPHDSTRQARLNDVPPPKRPTHDLGLLALATGDTTRVDRVQSYKLPDEGRDWAAYHHEPPRPDSSDSDEEHDDETDGAPLTLRHLDSGETWRYDHVTDYAVAEEGPLLTYTAADSTGKSLHAVRLDGDAPRETTLHASEQTYPQVALDDTGTQVAFLNGPDSTDAPHHDNTLYHWKTGNTALQALVQSGAAALPNEWLVSEQAGLSFSANGARVFFGTAPTPPAPLEQDSLLEDEQVEVDVWHWQDPYLQPMQKERADDRKEQTYRAVHVVDTGRTLQLATEKIPAVTVAAEGTGTVALGITNRPYRQELSWDWPPAYDAYLIDLQSGERTRVLRDVQAVPQLSPQGNYLAWWDREARAWRGLDTDTRERMTLSASIPHAVHDHRHDVPYPAGPYGLAGWTESDDEVLLYDRHDVWAVPPDRPDDAQAVTDELGRANNLRLRHVSLTDDRTPAAWGDWPTPITPPTVVPDTLLLSAFNTETKAGGFYRDRMGSGERPTELRMMDRSFSTPETADDADRLLYTRESVQEFPDLRVADRSFNDPERLSTVNPQQDAYRWATVELVEWTSANGEPLEGLLYKPADFDPDTEHPMMTYFYEQYSDDLHEHYAPAAHRSIINFTFYASRGYLVFVPDIHYEEGYPGESAMQSVMPGVTMLANRDYVDGARIGVQGHSWGGYQIAHMVTKTDLFAAAEAGAPVSNMISAYGGIRGGTGMSRMFQYEETQSRIGGSLWDTPMRYINNSPIFQADRIDTPLMMMHNDQDSAVPWEQGIELFVALRRLNKPAWLLNYTGEVHWPTDLAEMRDWTTRMQQFFDHYLKGAPAPAWLEEGVPAVDQGRTLGLEPVTGTPE
ncbi:alpha/beta hydrolase family protein [Salinibacter altiplanensis]|uniref:alpha/beta hydrolase family protein n=1 Tax=Salinibacter altiplanensis TaxID=1803181 RepID=UPI000C9EFFCA|nr:prolyl oligopeptidase family serine peptidase [Salinibacter altiplanensis]